MKIIFQLLAILSLTTLSFAQEAEITKELSPSLVDYEAYVKLVQEVGPHRNERLVTLEEFIQMSNQKNVLILDTRSKEMYDAKHVKDAIHLNFSDFTQENLDNLIPSTETKILIYCNNNFEDDQKYFATKSYIPPTPKKNNLGITMALNIPTYINLYGYGYKNVYELSELISVFDSRIQFEGTSVSHVNSEQ